jgi:hypothetical protein
MALKTRVQADEDLIRWPWEANELEVAIRQLQAEGSHILARLTRERESLRRSNEAKIAQVENRFQIEMLQVSAVDSRPLSGQRPDEIERLMKKARVLMSRASRSISQRFRPSCTESVHALDCVEARVEVTHRWELNQWLAIDDHKRLICSLDSCKSPPDTHRKDRPFVPWRTL